MKKHLRKIILGIVIIAGLGTTGAVVGGNNTASNVEQVTTSSKIIQNSKSELKSNDNSVVSSALGDYYSAISSIPEFAGNAVIKINNDIPFFTNEEKQYKGTFISLSELDNLNRCGVAYACVGKETEPKEERGDISHVHPSGWKSIKLKNGSQLYNRSHLLMYALTGLNDDNRNLITGTRQFNADKSRGMLAYEEMVKWVVDNYNAHVVYRVTPVFEGNNLIAKGVLMEAYCIEYPEECEFCVFIYNVEDNVTIDYANGNAVG